MAPKGPPGRQQNTQSVLMEWLGHRVVIKYLAGPDEPMDPDDPKGIAHAHLETRSGVFELHRIGQIGVEVSNTIEEAKDDRVTLIPWGAILSIRGSTPNERGGTDGRLSKEQMAEIALNDPT